MAATATAAPAPSRSRRVIDSKGHETDEEGEGELVCTQPPPLGAAGGGAAAARPVAWHRAWLLPSGQAVLGTLKGAEEALVLQVFSGSGSGAGGAVAAAAAPTLFFSLPGAQWGGAAWAKDGSVLYVTDSSAATPSIRVRLGGGRLHWLHTPHPHRFSTLLS